MSARIAVIVFNLGGPDGPKTIRPFLFNFFRDPNIVRLPALLRYVLAALIALRRSKKEAGTSYGFLQGRSPLLENTRAQAAALEKTLNNSGQGTFKTFTCMRYWHPMADAVAQDVKAFAPDRIVLLPLYPQYSTTTTRSSFESWDKAAKKAGLTQPASSLCCYPRDIGFIVASADHIRTAWQTVAEEVAQRGLKPPRLLFSAHGLPEKIIKDGDPYQWQCEQSAQAIAGTLAIPGLDWQICYQSKVGRFQWIGPSTIQALEQAAADKVPVVIYPHAFVSEHVETLVEIEIEYRHLAEKLGVPLFRRVETVGTHPAFIGGLQRMVLDAAAKTGMMAGEGARICPGTCGRCALNEKF